MRMNGGHGRHRYFAVVYLRFSCIRRYGRLFIASMQWSSDCDDAAENVPPSSHIMPRYEASSCSSPSSSSAAAADVGAIRCIGQTSTQHPLTGEGLGLCSRQIPGPAAAVAGTTTCVVADGVTLWRSGSWYDKSVYLAPQWIICLDDLSIAWRLSMGFEFPVVSLVLSEFIITACNRRCRHRLFRVRALVKPHSL